MRERNDRAAPPILVVNLRSIFGCDDAHLFALSVLCFLNS
jgi:hypothetical protein